MPISESKSKQKLASRSPSLNNLKAGNIIQRSSSAASLKALEDEKKSMKEAKAKELKKTGLRLFYYRYQLISGSYMLETWERIIFDIFVLLSLYVIGWNMLKLSIYLFKLIKA